MLNFKSKVSRLDKNKSGGVIMMFVRKDIPVRLFLMDKSSEGLLYLEINLGRAIWLISYFYNSHRKKITSHLHSLSKSLDYDNCP